MLRISREELRVNPSPKQGIFLNGPREIICPGKRPINLQEMFSKIPYQNTRRCALHRMDRRIQPYRVINPADRPPEGWLHAIRNVIRMPQRDLAERLSVTEQAVKQMEQREAAGTISIGLLQKAAEAMGLNLVYCFVPETDSLENMVESQILHYMKRMKFSTEPGDFLRRRMDRLLEKPQSQIWELKTRLPPRFRPDD